MDSQGIPHRAPLCPRLAKTKPIPTAHLRRGTTIMGNFFDLLCSFVTLKHKLVSLRLPLFFSFTFSGDLSHPLQLALAFWKLLSPLILNLNRKFFEVGFCPEYLHLKTRYKAPPGRSDRITYQQTGDGDYPLPANLPN
jgi:hypothetical protein